MKEQGCPMRVVAEQYSVPVYGEHHFTIPVEWKEYDLVEDNDMNVRNLNVRKRSITKLMCQCGAERERE